MSEETGSAEATAITEPIKLTPGGGASFEDLVAIEQNSEESQVEGVVGAATESAAEEIAKESIEEHGVVTEEAKVRIVKALRGEEELELEEDLRFSIKDSEVTLKDLVDSHIGQAEIDRRFSEFDKNKKALEGEKSEFEQSVKTIDDRLKRMNGLLAEGKSWEAMREMAVLSGQDPIEYTKNFVEQAIGVAKKFEDMTPEQIDSFWAGQKNDYLSEALKTEKEKREEFEKSQKEQEVIKTEQSQVKNIIKSEGLTEEQFGETYNYLKENGDLDRYLEQNPGATSSQITRDVCAFAQDAMIRSRVASAIEKVDPKLVKDEKLVDRLFKFTDYEDSVEDIVDVLNDYLGVGGQPSKEEVEKTEKPKEPSSKTVAKKKEAASSEKADSKGKKKEEPTASPEEPEDVLGWDDLPLR